MNALARPAATYPTWKSVVVVVLTDDYAVVARKSLSLSSSGAGQPGFLWKTQLGATLEFGSGTKKRGSLSQPPSASNILHGVWTKDTDVSS